MEVTVECEKCEGSGVEKPVTGTVASVCTACWGKSYRLMKAYQGRAPLPAGVTDVRAARIGRSGGSGKTVTAKEFSAGNIPQ